MLFNSLEFIFIFLPIAFFGFYFLALKKHSYAIAWLAFASLFFYGYWSLYSLPILVISIICNYLFGMKIANQHITNRHIWLVCAVILNLGLLGYFKYFNFFIENTNALRIVLGLESISFLNIVLPIGISFFTFTQIAFLMDSYQNKVQEKSFLNYVLFVTFFPHLIAGPIIHHKEMMPQFADRTIGKLNLLKISLGLLIFSIGLSKKILIADPLSVYADILFNGVQSNLVPQLFLSWLGSLAYTFQLYFDFSGYSDMAIGLALLFGIWLPINFNSPFKAINIIDFWQRWHMTLTRYINMYLYTPITLRFARIGANYSQTTSLLFSLVIPTMVIFLILGLWHGASWNYVVFGAMHGFFVVSNHLYRNFMIPYKKKNILSHKYLTFKKSLSWMLTFLAVNAAFVVFRSDSLSDAIKIYQGMLGINGFTLPMIIAPYLGSFADYGNWLQIPGVFSSLKLILLLWISFVLVLFAPNTASLSESADEQSIKLDFLNNPFIAIFCGLLFALSVANFSQTSSFLYFQF
ncbi:MBOAT family protein [Gammaproteobacteria bacterium]|jgi:alginate O-acetyltransferase complex protein AlgI|nr:MBOAT family protein [Gammaproteobacteria bacterium]